MMDKTVLITGGAQGIGKALAEFFHAQGATILIHYHTSGEAAESLKNHLGERVFLYQADLTKQEEIERVFGQIMSEHTVDVLINTVGPFIHKPFDEVSAEEFTYIINSNLETAFACSKAVVPQMKEKGGDIINFGCAGADRMQVTDFTGPYYLTKTAVITLTKIMAKTYAPHGIRVNCISPGIMENTVADGGQIPAGRQGTYEDICNAAAYLLSPEASYCNGANLEVAGGWTP